MLQIMENSVPLSTLEADSALVWYMVASVSERTRTLSTATSQYIASGTIGWIGNKELTNYSAAGYLPCLKAVYKNCSFTF